VIRRAELGETTHQLGALIGTRRGKAIGVVRDGELPEGSPHRNAIGISRQTERKESPRARCVGSADARRRPRRSLGRSMKEACAHTPIARS
jgi:hypothetical protein